MATRMATKGQCVCMLYTTELENLLPQYLLLHVHHALKVRDKLGLELLRTLDLGAVGVSCDCHMIITWLNNTSNLRISFLRVLEHLSKFNWYSCILSSHCRGGGGGGVMVI